MDAIQAFAEHVDRTRFEDLPAEAIRAAKIFILDTFGVGVAGSSGPWVRELIASSGKWGQGTDARVWANGARLPAPAAALCNAYQIHNSEFDCLHEAAVVHVLTAVLPAAMAIAERRRGVSGKELIASVALGVDLAANIGIGATTPLRFFRPGTCGGFGATAAAGKLLKLSADQMVGAFGITLGQLCGTMQAHTEGSALLGMQVGFNARNAIVACDMAQDGMAGARDVLEGPFGYYKLFEGEYDLSGVLPSLGKVWRLCEVAHKPFPSGRATHGVVDAVLSLKAANSFAATDIESIAVSVSPLVYHLVSRPVRDDMGVNYARLCASYVAARALLRDGVGVEDFLPDALGDPATLTLARRIELRRDDNPDPNTFTPISVTVRLRSGATHDLRLDVVYGNPARPLTRDAHLAKFHRNWHASATPLREGRAEALIAAIDRLEQIEDVCVLTDSLCPD